MKKRLSMGALLLAASLAATACGTGSTAATAAVQETKESSGQSSQAAEEGTKAGTPELDIADQQLTIGTASSGGAFYVVGTGLAEVITSAVGALNVTAEITGGSAENVRLVGTGESDMGISNANDVYFGYTGTEGFNQAYDLKVISSLHSSVLHIVTLGNTGVTGIEDLKGRKVAVGPAGGGSIYPMKLILEAYGLDFDKDITASYLSYDDGIEQLKDGQVDAALVMAGQNASSVQSLQATDKVVLLSVDQDKAADICKACPFYYGSTVEASVYDTDGDAYVLACRNLLYCSGDMDEDTVYAMTRAICENLDSLKEYHASLKGLTLEQMADTAGVPMHPGAERYFKEAGLL